MSKKTAVVLSAVVVITILGVALSWAQSAFPVRLDSPEPEVAAATNGAGVAISGSALYLPPQSSEPFACDASKEGWIYQQCTDPNTVVFSSVVLCVCQQESETDNYLWTQLHNDNQPCSSLAGSC